MYGIDLTYEGRRIHIEMEKRISILSDDSGIGKTFVAKAIKASLNVKDYSDIRATFNGNESDVEVIFDECSKCHAIDVIKHVKGIVIIDEADKLISLYPEIMEEIVHNTESAFLLILRGEPNNYITSPLQYLIFTTTGMEITIKPYKSSVNKFFKVG